MIYNIKFRIKIKILKIINFFLKFLKLNLLDIKKNNLNVIKELIGKSDDLVIFDVGANDGRSIRKYIKNFNHPKIHAFEPQNSEFTYLLNKYSNTENIFLNKNALGSRNENLSFKVNERSQSSGFYKFKKNFKFKNFENEKIEYKTDEIVEVVKIDDYCKKNNVNKIDLLKIDTECHEDHVLEGCTDMLKNSKIKIIEVEIIVGDIYEKRLSFYEIEKLLHNYGYRIFSIENSGNRIDRRHLLFNVLYVSKEIDNIYQN